MTDGERTSIADSLLLVIFALREDDSEAGQAWTLSMATTAMSRAILAAIGPQGDPTVLLELARTQVEHAVYAAQTKFFRERLTIAPERRS